MKVVTRARELRAERARLSGVVGLVPTMGALHAGHASLVERARRECAAVVVTLFVNPLQFGPREDFAAYPRDLQGDGALLERLGVDLLFAPNAAEVYPREPDIFVEPVSLGKFFEGERRPGHLRGVATIVTKLFNLVQPHRAYFGVKDAQQLAMIERMVADLNMSIEVVACPTLRESDGLAMSSRNAYLRAEERQAAPHLYSALRALAMRLEAGEQDVRRATADAQHELSPLRLDYIGVVRPDEFKPLESAPAGERLLVVGAAFAGSTRLIDNVKVLTPATNESTDHQAHSPSETEMSV